MTDARSLAERSARTPPEPAADFESFYLATRVRLFRALVVVTRDVHAAEEVSQDAFVAVWERWDRVSRMSDPTGYLYRTALNGWFQTRRRAARAARRTGELWFQLWWNADDQSDGPVVPPPWPATGPDLGRALDPAAPGLLTELASVAGPTSTDEC